MDWKLYGETNEELEKILKFKEFTDEETGDKNTALDIVAKPGFYG
jgi:uncharacterized protein YwgA